MGVISTNKHENDLNKMMLMTRIILRFIGAWPISRSASKTEKILTRLQIIICFSLCIFTIVPGFMWIFLKENDFKRRIRMVAPISNTIVTCIKYIFLIYHMKEYQICLEQMKQDWRNTVSLNDQKIMVSKARTGQRLIILTTVFLYIGGMSFRTIIPLSKGRIMTPMNTTVRVLACPSYFGIFDEQASPTYEIVFLLQFISGLFSYSVTCGAAGLAAFLIMHICGQFSILIEKLQRLNDMPKPEDRVVAMLLADIIEYQIKLKSFLKQVEEALQAVLLVEILGSSIMLCLLEYFIMTDFKNKDSASMITMIVIYMSFTFCIFTNCYVGQLLTDQSVNVGLMTSTISWHRLPLKRARALILIMAISGNPAKIFAGKLIELSLSTFGNIIKTSMTYFNLLYKFTV